MDEMHHSFTSALDDLLFIIASFFNWGRISP